MNINELFIYLEGQIYKVYKDEKGITRIRLKLPQEETINKTCLLLHMNKNVIKSGYIIIDKNKNIPEENILNEAAKKLNLVDITNVYMIKTELDNYKVYYYINKYEIERLFVDFEFKEIYPLEFFLYNMDPTGNIYGIISKDICYAREIEDLKSLAKEKAQSHLIKKEEDIPISVNSILIALNTEKHKYMLIDGGIDFIIEKIDENNKGKPGYIPFKEKNNTNENKNWYLPVINLKDFTFDLLITTLKEFNTFKFEDKVSTFYKAKKLKPFLIIFSILFITLSIYFVYQFINTQTINYIYNKKIENLNTEIKRLEKTRKEAIKNNFIPYYVPLDIKLLKEIQNIISSLNIDAIKKYKFDIINKSVYVKIITTDLNNVKIINNLKNKKIHDIELKKKNNSYEIKFVYGEKNKRKRFRR